MHITAGELRYVEKEADRKWEEGDDISVLEFKTAEYGRSEPSAYWSFLGIAGPAQYHSWTRSLSGHTTLLGREWNPILLLIS